MIRRYGGDDLAKVLLYCGLIGETGSSDFNICCPFHNDPNPSMRVTLHNGIWHCFGCGLTGNAYDFVKYAFPELDDLQAVVVLEKILNSREVKGLKFRYNKKKKQNVQYCLNEAKDYYYGLKQNDWYRPQSKEEQEALQYMKERGFSERDLTLCKCKANRYNSAYPLLFPIYDNNVFMGHVSRTTKQNVESKRKYLYNEGFKKRLTLCGTYRENSVVYVCEGFLDYLSLKARGGRKNVVAILGWHLADGQLEKLKRKNIKKIVCALDNPKKDQAGEKGLNLMKRFFDVIPFQYPEDIKDPGEMDKKQLAEAIGKTEAML